MRQLLAREEFKARNRAYSESTAVPVAGDTLTETFNLEIEVNGLRFSTVKLFHPRNGAQLPLRSMFEKYLLFF